MSHILLRWRPRHRNSTSAFGFPDFAHLRRSKSNCTPNFGGISQSTAEILLLPVSENKRPPCWNFASGSDFYVCITIGIHSASAYQISSKSDHPRRSYNFISIFKMAAWASQFYFRFWFFGDFAHLGRSTSTWYQISARYLNPRLRYYYFRFLKTNVRHVGILQLQRFINSLIVATAWLSNDHFDV